MNTKQIRPNQPNPSAPGKPQRPSLQTGVEKSDSKEILFLGAGLMTLTLGLGGLFMYSAEEPLPATASQEAADEVSNFKMTEAFATSTPSSATSPASPLATEPSLQLVANSSEPQEAKDTDVYFGFDLWVLSNKAKDRIKTKVEAQGEEWKGSLRIDGHTDAQGTDSYNRALGLKRAESVKTYLSSLGISEDRIQVQSFGKEGAVCQETTPDCFEHNRRAHLAFLPTSGTSENDGQVAGVSPMQNASVETDVLSNSQDSPTADSSMASINSEGSSSELISTEPLMTAESQP